MHVRGTNLSRTRFSGSGLSVRQSVRRVAGRAGMACAGLEQLEVRALLSANDPTPDEQYMLELLNRMRANPAAELGLLTTSLGNPARSADRDVDAAMAYFRTRGDVLAQQWASLTPAPPLAWSRTLTQAAQFHNGVMIDTDSQTHQAPGEPDLGQRATNAGYMGWTNLGENVFAYAESIVHGHAGFAIDWGGDRNTTGIQDPPGHRDSMMNANFREVGIRVTNIGNRPGKQTGPLVITQDFGRRWNQGNPFLLGVVFGDSNSNGYSPGEGYGNVTISAVAGNGTVGAPEYTTTSWSAGGWQMQVPAGTYAVTFSGGGFGAAVTYRNVVVSNQNVKLDGVRGVRPPAPVLQVWSNDLKIDAGDSTPRAEDSTDFGRRNTQLQSVTKSFAIYNAGNSVLNLASFNRVRISGSGASDFVLIGSIPAVLGPGISSVFSVTFDPSVVGLRTATVTIASDDPAAPSYSFVIQGRGALTPIVQVSGRGQVIAPGDATPNTVDWTGFGSVDALFGERTREFVISNLGQRSVNLPGPNSGAAVEITGANAELFEIVSLSSTSIAPGSSATVRVRFRPDGAVGLQRANLTIRSGDPLNPVYSFAIQGNAVAQPRVDVVGGTRTIVAGQTAISDVDRTSFGAWNVEGGVRERTYLVRNVGLANLTFTGGTRVTINGPAAQDFRVVLQPVDGTIGPGVFTRLRIRFDPTEVGTRLATVNIFTNDPGMPVFTFVIGGVGVV